MMIPPTLFGNFAYTPLSTSSRRQGCRLIVTTIIVFIVCFSTIWVGLGVNHSLLFSPQVNYQNLNPPPLVHFSSYPPNSSSSDKRAVVSTLYSDSYAIGVAVLGHSVRKANISSRLLLPYLEGRVSSKGLCIARAVGWEPVPVPHIPPPHNGKGIYHRFHDQYTKLNIWALDKVGIEQAVYLDADTLVRHNFDELFDIPFNFAAVPDIYGDKRGFTISFNAGVLAFRPSSAVLEVMKSKLESATFPLDQAEQSFLNLFFSTNALRLPYAYNANLAIKRRNPAMWEGIKDDIRIVHYTLIKPFVDETSNPPQILDREAQRKTIDRACEHNRGFYAQEVGWWRDMYEQMLEDVGDPMVMCARRVNANE